MAEAVRERRSTRKHTKHKKAKAKSAKLETPLKDNDEEDLEDFLPEADIDSSLLLDLPPAVEITEQRETHGSHNVGEEIGAVTTVSKDGGMDSESTSVTGTVSNTDRGSENRVATPDKVTADTVITIVNKEHDQSESQREAENKSGHLSDVETAVGGPEVDHKVDPGVNLSSDSQVLENQDLISPSHSEDIISGQESFYSATSTLSEKEVGPVVSDKDVSETLSNDANLPNKEKTEASEVNSDAGTLYPKITPVGPNTLKLLEKDLERLGIKTTSSQQDVANICMENQRSKQLTELRAKESAPAMISMRDTAQGQATLIRKFQPLTLEQLQSLYYNPELVNNVHFIDKFVQNEAKRENHEFLEILNSYLSARRHFLQAEGEINALQTNYLHMLEQVWTTAKHSINAKGPCGDGSQCKTTHLYDMCEFSEPTFGSMKQNLESIRHNLQNQFALYSYSVQLAKLQVESYIHDLFMRSPVLRDMPRNAPVNACLHHNSNDEHQIARLRDCISVLFSFHRRPINDEEFVGNTKKWTLRLVSALARVASYNDHLFILNHVMRCPAGVGEWAASLIQVPPVSHATSPPINIGSPILDHLMTCLATILMPIKGREDFICLMKEGITPDPQHGNTWIMVDSDGEEDEDPKNAWMYLLENDIVAILNQIPMVEAYKHIMLMTKNNDGNTGSYGYNVKLTTDTVLIKLFAFCTCLINLLGWGLQTHTQGRYRQLNKRIGRMIRQCVQYVSYHWENFQEANRHLLPWELLERLQMEYSQFFLRATNCILTAQRLGCWQFMTDMPYSTLSGEMAWQLVWLFHQGRGQTINPDTLPSEDICRKFISNPDSRQQLCDSVQRLPTSEAIYLLTALANIAQSRRQQENDIIHAICFCIFEVCYVCSNTREMCSKVGRELLAAIATIHPFILSMLIQEAKDNMDNIGMMAVYLFKELPFDIWLPRESDFDVLRQWLLSTDLTDPSNQVARLVLNKINWGVESETNRLFVPYDFHKMTAVLLTEAYEMFVTNKNLGFWFLKGMKQVAQVVKQQQTSEQQFNNWSWEVVMKLHLHISCLPLPDLAMYKSAGGPPDITKDNSFLAVSKGVKEKNPMACFVAVVGTSQGHNATEFLAEGLSQLCCLVENNHYRPALLVLNCTSSLFLNNPKIVTENDRFMKCISGLLTADDSILKISKLWTVDFPGPMTKLFSCMIQDCIDKAATLPGNSALFVAVDFWIRVIIKTPKWFQDRNCCYIVDNLVKVAFTHKVGMELIQPSFQETFQGHYKESAQQGAMSTLVSWMSSGSNCAMIPSLIERLATPETFGWLTFLILDIEYHAEAESKVWYTLKEEIHIEPKLSPEQALKKAVTKLKLQVSPGLHSLNIYRWGRQALDMDVEHPMAPLVWQRFFGLFLGRMLSQVSMQQRASVGEKFYDVSKHTSELKKMKKKLKEAVDYHINYQSQIQHQEAESTRAEERREETGEVQTLEEQSFLPRRDFHQQLTRLYQTFQLWTEEPMLHDAKLYLPALPPQYQSDRLLLLFQNQVDPWLETVDHDRVVFELAQMTSEWNSSLLGSEVIHTITKETGITATATEKIKNRLENHDPVRMLPDLPPLKAVVEDISITVMQDRAAIMHVLKADLVALKEYAKSFTARTSQHVACDEDFSRLLPQLYYNRPKQVKVTIECKSSINPLHKCSNPAVVIVNIREKATDEVVQRQTDENRAEFKQLLIEGVNPPPQNVCVSVVHVENAITMLVKLSRSCTDDARLSYYNDVACSLFFHLAESFNHDIQFYPPTRQFFSSCMDLLGKEFIQQNASQTEFVLQFSLDNPTMAGHMSPHFIPLNSAHRYVTMYERLVQVLQQKAPHLVFTLLTKFDIDEWMTKATPAQTEIKRYGEVLGRALYSCGANPDSKHELVFEIYCTHLNKLLQHRFPSNVMVVLNILLQGSDNQQIHVKCWNLLHMACFGNKEVQREGSPSKENEQEVVLTTDLTTDQVQEVLQWMGTYYLQLRMSSSDMSMFGLYPSLQQYIPYLKCIIRDLLVCLTHKMASQIQDDNYNQVLDLLWQTTLATFNPWLQTHSNQDGPLFPWIQADAESGKELVKAFRHVVFTIFTTFQYVCVPYQRDILSEVWQYFACVLCTRTTPSHVTQVYTEVLRHLPWDRLTPSIPVLHSMVQLKDTNSAESFELLAHIVCQVDWTSVLQFYSQSYPGESFPGEGQGKVLNCVLILFTQSFGDQKHIEIPMLEQKMQIAEKYDWQMLTSDSFRHACNWLLQTCDPACVLVERSSSTALGIRLIKAASGFSVHYSSQWTSELSSKRQCYVHTVVQLLCQCTFSTNTNLGTLSTAILNLMTEVETVSASVVDLRMQRDETLDLVKEIFGLLNNCNPENSSLDVVMTTVIEWLQSSPQSILLLPCVKAASRCLASHSQIVCIVEECIHVYFKGGMDQTAGGGWDQVLAAIQIPDLNTEEFLDTALQEESYLLLYGYCVLQQPLCLDAGQFSNLVNIILTWINKAKPTAENESKLMLLCFKLLDLVLRQLDFGTKHAYCIKTLNAFVSALHQMGEDRASTGILGAIGLGKRSTLSTKFRVIARSLSAMVSSQIYGDTLLRMQPNEPLANTTQTKTEIAALQALKSNKQYQQYRSQIQTACDIVKNESNCLQDVFILLRSMCVAFYPDKEYLSVINQYK
ncbi:ectopic P granules protein 5 homolog [Ylistrum balloti]|uniref:ectopic P granules protein 5 homolog n=1 Tax=Ylistrum balloti TaxID=509963 RepID=UPI002905B395|nr:ectopic P granules protein 5 homolog [Ylistrum balloti]